MKNLKLIDFISAIVATVLWFLGGFLFLLIPGILFATIFHGRSDLFASPLVLLVGLFMIAGFIFGTWLSIKFVFRKFLTITKQNNAQHIAKMFYLFSWISIFSLLIVETISKDSLLISYLFWTTSLIVIYLVVKTNSSKI